MWEEYVNQLNTGNVRAISRCISLIENRVEGYEKLLRQIIPRQVPVIGITGPPGAGKSTLADALIQEIIAEGKKVAILCVDPSSPFTYGSLLGDRIRMNKWHKEPRVYIRSLSTRGSLGGLHPMIIEIADLLRAADFDMIIIETVGIGQSEIEIAGIADLTMVVLVPEAGDDIQAMKAGLMEIADVFVVNKSDRPGAGTFASSLKKSLPPHSTTPVIQVISNTHDGIAKLYSILKKELKKNNSDKKRWLMADKAYQLIREERMKDINKESLLKEIEQAMTCSDDFNLYRFIQSKFL